MSSVITLATLVAILGTIYWFRNRGCEKAINTDHEFFSRLWLWPRGEHTRWEAEYDIESPYSDGTVGLHAEDNYEVSETPEPTARELQFSKKYLSDLKLLFPLATEGVRQGWKEWFHEELPENWQAEFIVNGFSVPARGDVNNHWGITLFCEKAGHYFCIAVDGGISKLESIDG